LEVAVADAERGAIDDGVAEHHVARAEAGRSAMGVVQQVERPVDRQLLYPWVAALVAAGEQLALPPVAEAAGQGGASPVGDPGDTLAPVAAFGREAGGDRHACGRDPVGVEVEGDPPGPAQLRH
jgi:hypothetical protein